MITMQIIKDFFEFHEYSKEEVRLNQCTVIQDQKKFVEAHLSILKAQTGKIRFMPYFERVKQLYIILKNKQDEGK